MKSGGKERLCRVIFSLAFALGFLIPLGYAAQPCGIQFIRDCSDFSSVSGMNDGKVYVRACEKYSCTGDMRLSMQIVRKSTSSTGADVEAALDFYSADPDWPDSDIWISNEVYYNADDEDYDCCYSMDNSVDTECSIYGYAFGYGDGSYDCGPNSLSDFCENTNVTTNQTTCIRSYDSTNNTEYMSFNVSFPKGFDLDCLNFTLTQCWSDYGSFGGCYYLDGTSGVPIGQGENHTAYGDATLCTPLNQIRVDLYSPTDDSVFYSSNSNYSFECAAWSENLELRSLALYTNASGSWALYQNYTVPAAIPDNISQIFNMTIANDDEVIIWNCLVQDHEDGETWSLTNFTFNASHDNPPNMSWQWPIADQWVQTGTFSVVCNATDDFLVTNMSIWHNASGSMELNQTVNVSSATAQVAFNMTNMEQGTYNFTCGAYDNRSTESYASYLLIHHHDSNATITISTTNNSNYSFVNFTLQFNVKSPFNMANLTLYGNFSGTWKANATVDSGNANGAVTFNLTHFHNGTFLYTVFGTSNSSNQTWATLNNTLTINPCWPSSADDWNISSVSCTLSDQNLKIPTNKKLFIKDGAQLIMHDSNISFFPANEFFGGGIFVQDGLLYLNKSRISSSQQYNETYASTTGTFKSYNSIFNNTFKMDIHSSAVIFNSTFHNSGTIRFYGHRNNITYSTFDFFEARTLPPLASAAGLIFDQSNYNNISFNYIGNYSGNDTIYGIGLSSNSNHSTIAYNQIGNITNTGDLTYGIYAQGFNNSIYNNTISGLAGQGGSIILVEKGENRVYNNIIKDSTMPGGSGIYASLDMNTYRLSIKDNVINVSDAIQIYLSLSPNHLPNRVNVTGNRILAHSSWKGIYLEVGKSANISNNHVEVSGRALDTVLSGSHLFYENDFISLNDTACYIEANSGGSYFIGSNCTTQAPNKYGLIAMTSAAFDEGITDAVLSNDSGSLVFGNATFDNLTADGTTNIQVWWKMGIAVQDTAGNPVNLANLRVLDNLNESWFTAITNASGKINQSWIMEYLVNGTSGSTKYWTNFTINATHAGYINKTVSVNVTDSSYHTVTLTDIRPQISYVSPTLNNTYLAQNWIFINISAYDATEQNITFSIFNSSGLVENVTYTGGNRSHNFTGLTVNTTYLFNVTIMDLAGNINSTGTNNITLDTYRPLISYGAGTESNNSALSRNWIYINVSAYDEHEANITFFLSDASQDIINASNFSVGYRTMNFTNLSEGMYFYNATIIDMAGNLNSTATYQAVLSSGTPVITAMKPANNFGSGSVNVTFNFTAFDSSPANCSLYMNVTGSWAINQTINWTSNQWINFSEITLPYGNHLWNVYCNDTTGLGSSFVTNYTVRIDTTAPTISSMTAISNKDCFYMRNSSDTAMWIYHNSNVARCDGQTANILITYTDDNPDMAAGNTTFGDTPINNSNLNTVSLRYTLSSGDANASTLLWVKDATGTNDTALVTWYRDPTSPVSADNITYTWLSDNARINISANDSYSGLNHTKYCYYDYLGSTCTPNIETRDGLGWANCTANSACQYMLRYYSVDNVSNTESTKESLQPIFIVRGSSVTGTNASNTNISDNSDISGSNLTDSNISACKVVKSNISSSILRYDSSYTYNCTIDSSKVYDSKVTSSKITRSVVDPSVIVDSIIIDSNITDSTVYYSRVENSDICTGCDLYSAVILDNILISGRVIKDGKTYLGGVTMSSICGGAEPSPIGNIVASPSIVKDNSTIRFYYTAYGLGWTAFFPQQQMQKLDINATRINLTDDGIAPDVTADDRTYTARWNITYNNNITDGNKTLFLNITDVLSNDWLLNVMVTLDNTKPSATMKIIPISQPGWENVSGEYTGSTTVVLNMTYSDLNSISRCRYYETAWTDWETCIPQRTFLLSGSDGLKTVIYEVRDTAGNINRTNDTITLNQTGGGLDITPPTSPIVVDDGNYTNSNSQLHAYWYNSTDRENELLAIDLDYEYRIYNGSAYIVNWTFTEGTEITKTGLSLRNGSNYTFEVKAINSVGLKSANATSDGIIADHDVPAAPIVNSSSHPSPTVWYGNSSATLNWSSGDSNSGIGAYSFILDTISTTIPDDIPEGTLNQLDQKITHLYTNLGDGTFYFHIKARDKADNWGSTTHFSFKIDTTSPSTPQLGPVGSYIGAGNTSFNWTMSSDLQSGVSNYYLQVSNRSDFNNTIYSAWVGNKTNQSLTISEATIYYAKVRSQNGAGLNSTYSNAISTVLDTQPPKLLFYKPSGTVISPTVILRVDTDEDATCRYRVTTPPGIWRNFSYTGETIHESRLTSLSTTSYAYTYSCYDAVGNENTTDITFTHSALAPTSITYVTAARGFTNSIVSFNVSVTSSGTGLGEIKKSSTSLRLNTHYPDYNMDDRGDGLYEISFRAPMNEGNYSMVFNVSGITGSSTAEILDISLGLTYRGGGLQASSSTHMAFSRQSNYLFGMASDSSSVSTSGTASQLTITANTADGKIYIFATDPGARVETREHLLKDRTFKDNVLQSFGRQIDADEQKVYTLLEYDDIMIRSDTNRAEELGPGVYNLVIRNTNITSGKTLIEVVT